MDSTLDNPSIARDAYNYCLHYFAGDYKPIGTTLPIVNASGNVDFKNLYNGNIGAMAVNIKKLSQATEAFSFDGVGILKGKLAIKIFKTYPKLKEKPYWGNHFWSRGYFVSTIDIDEDMIRRYKISGRRGTHGRRPKS